MTRGRLVSVLACCMTLVLAACSNVPTSSAPQVIRPVDVGPPPAKPAGPLRGANPRAIVEGFLLYNTYSDVNHNGARQYLSPRRKGSWHDTSLTVLDRITVSNPHDDKVIVQGREIGSIDDTQQAGVYTPALRGDGSGGALVRETFKLRQVHGQWRISGLPNGLLVTQPAFETNYHQYGVYFLDSTGRHLVPEPRYSEQTDSKQLATWLVDALVDGPVNAPQGGPSNHLPSQTAQKPAVQFSSDGSLIKIEITGVSSLPAADRNRVAAEFGATLGQVGAITSIEITDGGTPVTIPALASSQFAPAAVSQLYTLESAGATPNLYYLHKHVVYDSNSVRLPGRINDYGLVSVCLSSRPDGTVQAAGVRSENGHGVLDVGTTSQLYRTAVKGALSRPAWAPDVDEAWIGAGSDLYRVSMPSRTVRHVAVDVPPGSAKGTIVAVRLSPEGSRVALVLRTHGTSQIYIGVVVRNGTSVRVVNLVPISPQSVLIRDVAWNDQFKLFAIGTDKLLGGWGLWEMQSDGSLWTERSSSGLPQAPSSLTVASGSVAVVSAGPTVWQQQASAWEPLSGDETDGRNPIYEE